MRSSVELPEKAKAVDAEGDGAPKGARKLDRLALLFESILTVIGRVHTGRQRMGDSEVFRARMKQALAEVAASAAKRGYSTENFEQGKFAVVAFLDEAILTAPDGGAANWVGKSLGEELYNLRSAGEEFFKRLEVLRANRDSQDLAEVLEVYYLCLLLGYEGKFAGGSKGELLQLMANLRDRIDRILDRDPEFSPDRELPDEPAPPAVAADPLYRQLRLFALAAFLFALLCFVGFSWALHSQADAIHHAVQDRLGGGVRP
jgi:type VI secretion system protein ImpK